MGALSLPWYVFVTVVVYFMSLFIGLAVESVAVRPLQQLYDRAIGQVESFLHRKMNV